jgi:hypothetical protein
MSNSNVSKASQPPTQKKQLKRKRSVDNTANSSRPSKKTKRSKGGNTKAKATPKPKPAPKPHPQDPSTSYLASPLSAPIVEEAKSFFRSLCGQKFQFNVSVGATTGWRTQGKKSNFFCNSFSENRGASPTIFSAGCALICSALTCRQVGSPTNWTLSPKIA